MDCDACTDRLTRGRKGTDPIHCRTCHQTWTGNEAQHCVICHMTFNGIVPADHHRNHRVKDAAGKARYIQRCIDPSVTDGWREVRPGVWTDREVVEK